MCKLGHIFIVILYRSRRVVIVESRSCLCCVPPDLFTSPRPPTLVIVAIFDVVITSHLLLDSVDPLTFGVYFARGFDL